MTLRNNTCSVITTFLEYENPHTIQVINQFYFGRNFFISITIIIFFVLRRNR